MKLLDLINQSPTMDIITNKDLSPKIGLATLDQISSLMLEHRVVVCDRNKFIIAKTLCIGDIRKVWIPSLAELSDD